MPTAMRPKVTSSAARKKVSVRLIGGVDAELT
jgi:ribosomal protein S12